MSAPATLPAAEPRVIEVEGIRYWIRDLACGGWYVNRELAAGPAWSGRPWWEQIAGPFDTDEAARRGVQPPE